MQLLENKNNLITLLAVILGLVVLIYVVGPALGRLFAPKTQVVVPQETNMKEQFNSEEMPAEMAEMAEAPVETAETEVVPAEDANGPYVDSKTGALIDGPGFEKGEIDDVYREPSSSIPSNYYFLDDGAGGEMSIQHNLCSKSCCSAQWPTPFKQKYDPYVCQNKDKFIPSNIMCSNTFQDAGCLCLSKKQGQHLYNRGGNGREWF